MSMFYKVQYNKYLLSAYSNARYCVVLTSFNLMLLLHGLDFLRVAD